MCRFIAYLGEPLILEDVIFKPTNSLIKQSIHAQEKDERLNGDGFGLGWYRMTLILTRRYFVRFNQHGVIKT